MKEIYTAKLPNRIIFGDPWYFERFSREKLKGLVVDFCPPKHFQTRVVLEEAPCEDFPDEIIRVMSIYMAPAETMDTYMQGMIYKSQTHTVEEIGVDSARYLLQVDDRDDIISTGGDGFWGNFQKMTRKIKGKTVLDAAVISVVMPCDDSMDAVRRRFRYFFEDSELIENVEES